MECAQKGHLPFHCRVLRPADPKTDCSWIIRKAQSPWRGLQMLALQLALLVFAFGAPALGQTPVVSLHAAGEVLGPQRNMHMQLKHRE